MPEKMEEIIKLDEVNNLLNIYSGFSGTDKQLLIDQYKGQNFSNFKSDLSDVLVEKIKPITVEIKKLMEEKEYILNVLLEGQNKANEVAQETIKQVYDIVGLLRNET